MAETETDDIDRENEPLLRSLRADLPALETLLDEVDSHWGFEDPFYRAKTFLSLTVRCATALQQAPRLLPSGCAAVLYLYNVR